MSAQRVKDPSGNPELRVQTLVQERQRKERQRVWHPKVRTGCITCKQRKVRCDEIKPICNRCKIAGYLCGYAPPPKTWLFEPGRPTVSESSANSQTTAAIEIVRSLSPPGDHTNIYEQRALTFFKERTAPILATFAPCALHFWTNIVPRLASSNQAVRSALVAVASLHEAKHYRRQPSLSSSADEVFAEHHAKTITALTRQDQPPPPEVILITCFIFIACENLKLVGSAPAELMHVESGLKVLREWKANAKHTGHKAADSMPDVMENLLEPMFARLEAQTFLWRNMHAARAVFRKYDLNWAEPKVADTFGDLFIARDCMHEVVQYIWYSTQALDGPLLANTAAFKTVVELMKRWEMAFKASFPLLKDRNWPPWKVAAALQIHYASLMLSLYGEALDSSLYWDLHEDKVKWLLDACAEIIAEGPPSPTQQGGSQLDVWLYDFCLGPPLFLCANNCRHPQLRRRAIELQRKQHLWNQKDDPWDACWTAKMSELIMTAEEQGLENIQNAEDVPESDRIRVMEIGMSNPGEITIWYLRSPFITTERFTMKWDHWRKPPVNTITLWPFGEQ